MTSDGQQLETTTEEEHYLTAQLGPNWRAWPIEHQEGALALARAALEALGGTFDLAPVSVHVALARAKARIGAVAKDRNVAGKAGEKGYSYRGIDGILGAVHQITAEEGIVIVPKDLEWTAEPWLYYQSDAWRLYKLRIKWTIYGPDGSTIVTRNWGEALDNADKGLGKARSYAQKDLLIRIYEIPTDDPDVGDTEATDLPEARNRPTSQEPVQASEAEILAVANRLEAALERTEGHIYPLAWREAKPPRLERLQAMATGDEARCSKAMVATMNDLLESWETGLNAKEDAQLDRTADSLTEPDGDEKPGTGPETGEPAEPDHCELCGSGRTNLALVDGVWRCQDPKGCARRAAERDKGSDEQATVDAEDAPVCAGCGEPITDPMDITYDGAERPHHTAHNPLLGGTPDA